MLFNIPFSEQQTILSHIDTHKQNKRFINATPNPKTKGFTPLEMARCDSFVAKYLSISNRPTEALELSERVFDVIVSVNCYLSETCINHENSRLSNYSSSLSLNYGHSTSTSGYHLLKSLI
jgi:hypothetical protein